MRKAFVKTLIELAKHDKDIYLLTGDLGFHAFEEFREMFPDRFINCGVAEQTMVGIGAGLALAGKKPYVYSIVPFVTLRAFEQIRDDVCYQNLNVKIIGTGGGFSYGPLGGTHCVMEDLAVLRTLPNMTVISPSDLLETEELVVKSYQKAGPAYVRLSNAGNYKVHDVKPDLTIGLPHVVKDGKDVAVIATGLQLAFCAEIMEALKIQGVDAKLIGMHTLKPIDKKALLKELDGFAQVFTFEEHGLIGGLGSVVAEIISQSDWKGNFKMFGMPDEFPAQIGDAAYMRQKYGIDKEGIMKSILSSIIK